MNKHVVLINTLQKIIMFIGIGDVQTKREK